MRVVTWNMNYWQTVDGAGEARHEEAWRWLYAVLRPDVLLCQECVPPPWVSEGRTVLFDRAYPYAPWGTGLVTSLPCKAAPVPGLDEWLAGVPASYVERGKKRRGRVRRAAGWVASGQVQMGVLGKVFVTSVHNPFSAFELPRLEGIDVTPMRLKLNPRLWLLDVLLYFARPLLGQRLLLGGDFNASRLLDDPTPQGNNELFDRIADEGFVSLHRKFHDADEQTHFVPGNRAHQLDYLYGDALVAEMALGAHVHPFHEAERFSDHAPLVVDLAT
jgi:exonuclease III